MTKGIKWIMFATGWMSFRAIGSSLILFWTITKNESAAPYEWIVSLTGDFKKAQKVFNYKVKTNLDQLISIMMENDLKIEQNN